MDLLINIMPDATIPAALIVTLGVIFSAVIAAHSGDYRASTMAGIVGTIFNLICFYRRLAMQAQAEQRRSQRRDDLGQSAD